MLAAYARPTQSPVLTRRVRLYQARLLVRSTWCQSATMAACMLVTTQVRALVLLSYCIALRVLWCYLPTRVLRNPGTSGAYVPTRALRSASWLRVRGTWFVLTAFDTRYTRFCTSFSSVVQNCFCTECSCAVLFFCTDVVCTRYQGGWTGGKRTLLPSRMRLRGSEDAAWYTNRLPRLVPLARVPSTLCTANPLDSAEVFLFCGWYAPRRREMHVLVLRRA